MAIINGIDANDAVEILMQQKIKEFASLIPSDGVGVWGAWTYLGSVLGAEEIPAGRSPTLGQFVRYLGNPPSWFASQRNRNHRSHGRRCLADTDYDQARDLPHLLSQRTCS